MGAIPCVLLTDGPSDRALLPILRWLLGRASPDYSYYIVWADITRCPIPRRDLAGRIRWSLDQYKSRILFVHRDAEAQGADVRYREIEKALAEVAKHVAVPAHVCVVPIRMSEAWLLADADAIRCASGNPAGRVALELPRLDRIEDLPNPKENLHGLLRQACELTGRRLKKFHPEEAALQVAEHIRDFAPLRALSAFRRLEADIARLARQIASEQC